ncbi:hypothetical protein DRW41_10760 [Neobacillus piezotolerans]|uniref:Uncharacterized protein n=1 Tax=Neobacillus piezotolerans TaxID=2259171 RepID=A0A3D8GRP9_9BACI|nr:hypothetical protein [Neobacillus piezotolerans]RDU37153.1 hypothetical protein DRW41_10760 [Neobacillus piezotolerans]
MLHFFFLLRIVTFLFAVFTSGVDNVVEVDVNYWENGVKNQQVDVLLHKEDKRVFVDAVHDAKKMDEDKLIRTKPSLTINIMSKEGDYKGYELWITSDGKSYMESLDAADGGMFKLSKSSVKELTEFLETKGKADVIQNDVEFEE